jgi:xanthine dehydrogenase accessory factor
MKELSAIVAALCSDGASGGVLATLVSVAGSSYRRPGARLLVMPDGRRLGSISGGCLEEDVMARAARVQTTGQPDAVVYDTTSGTWAMALATNSLCRRITALAITHGGDNAAQWGTRLAAPGDCADPEALFLDLIAPPTALGIFGAGDDAQPLVRLAKELGWHVTIADPRAAFATKQRFPNADTLVVAPADTLVDKIAPGPDALAVVMTHHYVHDVPLLRGLLARPLAYLGLLGPKKRAEKILADLDAEGVAITPEQRARLHAPVGLDLGADSPEQVALSIIAEMQAALTGRNARPLRERTSPIHG